jgi:hypothetical protein
VTTHRLSNARAYALDALDVNVEVVDDARPLDAADDRLRLLDDDDLDVCDGLWRDEHGVLRVQLVRRFYRHAAQHDRSIMIAAETQEIPLLAL